MQLFILIYDGSSIWQEGLQVLAENTPQVRPGRTIVQESAQVGLRRGADSPEFLQPAWVLSVIAAEETYYDRRLDLAVSSFIQRMSPEQQSHVQPAALDIPSRRWLDQNVLDPAKEAIENDLGDYLSAHGSLPEACTDKEGAPLVDVLPSLRGMPNCNRTHLACWFQGWPGFRIQTVGREKRTYSFRVSGDGVSYDDIWRFTY